MITCTLKDKKYAVDFISGRALREMEPAAKMYAKIVALSNAAVKGEEIPQEAADQRHRRDGRDDPLVLPAVRESVQPGRCAGRLSRGSPDARHCAGVDGRADPNHRNSQSSSLRRRRRNRRANDGSGRDSAVLTLPEFIYSTYNSLAGIWLAHGRDRPHGHAGISEDPRMERKAGTEKESASPTLH